MDPSREIPSESFDQPEGSKLSRKMKESPFMVAGKLIRALCYDMLLGFQMVLDVSALKEAVHLRENV